MDTGKHTFQLRVKKNFILAVKNVVNYIFHYICIICWMVFAVILN